MDAVQANVDGDEKSIPETPEFIHGWLATEQQQDPVQYAKGND